MQTTHKQIENFLEQKRLAFVGVSQDSKDFSRNLFRDLQQRGYEVIPINPKVAMIEGETCYSRVQDISPPADTAFLMTPPQVTDQIVRDCAEAGIRIIWMHRGAGSSGAVSQKAIDFCQENGIEVIPGFCPYMFLPNTGFFHKVHGFMMKLSGKYPI